MGQTPRFISRAEVGVKRQNNLKADSVNRSSLPKSHLNPQGLIYFVQFCFNYAERKDGLSLYGPTYTMAIWRITYCSDGTGLIGCPGHISLG